MKFLSQCTEGGANHAFTRAQVLFLRQMELARNRIGKEGALMLVEALQQAPLVSLGLVENGLPEDVVTRMMQLKPKMSVLQMSIIDTHASSVRAPACCCVACTAAPAVELVVLTRMRTHHDWRCKIDEHARLITYPWKFINLAFDSFGEKCFLAIMVGRKSFLTFLIENFSNLFSNQIRKNAGLIFTGIKCGFHKMGWKVIWLRPEPFHALLKAAVGHALVLTSALLLVLAWCLIHSCIWLVTLQVSVTPHAYMRNQF
jgi:hypothetical protein